MTPTDDTHLFRVGAHRFFYPTGERIAFLRIVGCPLLAQAKHTGAPRKASDRNIEDVVFVLAHKPDECTAILSRGYEHWRESVLKYRQAIGEADYARIVFYIGWTLREVFRK